jgi:AbrB family looped-hinge helix DNA binding protein
LRPLRFSLDQLAAARDVEGKAACCNNRGASAKFVLPPLNDRERAVHTSKVSSKWQVVIPRQVREAEQIRVGSEVAFERTAQGILLRPVGAGKRMAPEQVYGILKTRRRAATQADIARAVRSAAVRRERRRRTAR